MIRAKFECLEDLEWICVSKSTEVFQELENWVSIEDIPIRMRFQEVVGWKSGVPGIFGFKNE